VEFSDFCRKLHINKTVGLEELGARKKPLHHLDRKHPSRINALVNMAYGYGLEVTPLHTLAIYNAVANNGRMVAPRIILRTERNGKVVNEAPVRVIEDKICSQRTIDTLRSFMEEVSLTGTAAEYFGEKRCSFRTGSKTGTAQVDSEINGVRYKRGDGYYYGSMVTYLPADNPRYTIMTAIFTKRQSGKTYYGAGLAGPVERDIVNYIYYRDEDWHQTLSPSDEKHYPSTVKGGNIASVRRVADKFSPRVSFTDREGWGKAQVDTMKNVSIETLADDGLMPNVVGMGLNDALYLLESRGLRVHFSGKGMVRQQSIPAGRKIQAGQTVSLTLR
jgi:cell division protein FtsI (penicillin-binding protein 3)